MTSIFWADLVILRGLLSREWRGSARGRHTFARSKRIDSLLLLLEGRKAKDNLPTLELAMILVVTLAPALLQPAARNSASHCRLSPVACRLGGDFRGGRSPEDKNSRELARAQDTFVPSDAPQRRQRPLASRARITRSDAGSLVVDVPQTGFRTDSLFSGAFSLAWFSAVAPATFTRGAPILFMLPFWVAGSIVAKTAVLDPFVSSTLTIGRYKTESSNRRFRPSLKAGPAESLPLNPVDPLSAQVCVVAA